MLFRTVLSTYVILSGVQTHFVILGPYGLCAVTVVVFVLNEYYVPRGTFVDIVNCSEVSLILCNLT